MAEAGCGGGLCLECRKWDAVSGNKSAFCFLVYCSKPVSIFDLYQSKSARNEFEDILLRQVVAVVLRAFTSSMIVEKVLSRMPSATKFEMSSSVGGSGRFVAVGCAPCRVELLHSAGAAV